jgi:hypothetical protein
MLCPAKDLGSLPLFGCAERLLVRARNSACGECLQCRAGRSSATPLPHRLATDEFKVWQRQRCTRRVGAILHAANACNAPPGVAVLRPYHIASRPTNSRYGKTIVRHVRECRGYVRLTEIGNMSPSNYAGPARPAGGHSVLCPYEENSIGANGQGQLAMAARTGFSPVLKLTFRPVDARSPGRR